MLLNILEGLVPISGVDTQEGPVTLKVNLVPVVCPYQ